MADKYKPWKDTKVSKKKPKHVKMKPYNRCRDDSK